MMALKTLTISEEAYKRLVQAKKTDESFTEVIIRLTLGRANLLNHAGAWADLEEARVETVFEEIRGAWEKWKPW